MDQVRNKVQLKRKNSKNSAIQFLILRPTAAYVIVKF